MKATIDVNENEAIAQIENGTVCKFKNPSSEHHDYNSFLSFIKARLRDEEGVTEFVFVDIRGQEAS